MNGIGHLLEKLKRTLFLHTVFVESVSETVAHIVGVKIPSKNISFRNGKIFISSSPIVKSELLLNKSKIIEIVRAQHPETAISDIV
ncbi:MAG: hypothetical protein AAB587_00465 [Patescibacteria group bacterium]